MKIDKNKIIYIFLLLQPIIDLLTGITTKLEIGFISVGIIIRGLFIFSMLIYLLFYCHTKYRKISLIYVLLIFVYGCFYYLTKTELLTNFSFFVTDTIYIFKYIYFLLLFITLFNYYIENHLDYRKIIKIFIIDLLMYVILIIFPYITNTSFSSYAENRGNGVVGWFYAANDISAIITILFPFLVYKINKKFSLASFLIILATIFTSWLIGTKVAYLGIIFTLVFGMIYYLFYLNKKWPKFLFLLLLLAITIISGYDSFVFTNIRTRIDKYIEYQENGTNEVEDETEITVDEDDTIVTIVILSSRDKLLQQTYEIYNDSSLSEKIFGIGFSNRSSINNEKIEKLVEIDFFDILFHGGIFLVILYFLPYIFIVLYFFKYIRYNHFKINLLGWMLGYLIILVFGISCVSGHVFSSPAVLIYYTLIIIMFLEYFKIEKNLHKKISLLLLHLGNGGIEKASVNLANALAKYYEVELVVAYKQDKVLYEIDPTIKIKYLIDNDIAFRMNKYKRRGVKNLFKDINEDYLQEGRLKELFNDLKDSVKVLYLRKKEMINYIRKSDSDIIISSRVEYSVLLSKYGDPNVKKIAIEHRHHNNDKKYIRMIRNNYNNINYLVVLTDSLKEDYQSFLKKNSKTEVITIPNMITNYPDILARLKNHRVISVGRIVPGKRIDEIVSIASHFKDWNFEIIGDGSEKDNIEKMIKIKNLNNIKMLGDMKNEDVLNRLKDASIFIMTSETEGLPMVLLEAFSCGIPVVCYETDSGTIDIVDDDINGYIIKNRNQKEMISKLELLMNNQKKRKQMGKKAYQKALTYSEEEIIKKWLEII